MKKYLKHSQIEARSIQPIVYHVWFEIFSFQNMDFYGRNLIYIKYIF